MCRVDGDGANGSHLLVLEKRRPALAVVFTDPQPTTGRSCVDGRRDVRVGSDARDPATHPRRTDVSNTEPFHDPGQWR